MIRLVVLTIVTFVLVSCSEKKVIQKSTDSPATAPSANMMIANLDDEKDLIPIFKSFKEKNPGYDLAFFSQTKKIAPQPAQRIAFLQKGGGTARLANREASKVSVGDIIVLDPGQQITLDSLVDLLVFTTPEPLEDSIPKFIRPDWDPNITDIPGGCATESNAYRRILLTWLGKVGNYLYKSLNAHRVRIMDSFSHYHPVEGGFDEFYLVQMVMPGAALITCDRSDLLENHEGLSRDQIAGLFKTTPLQVGDLIYLPRGVMHRGIGGVLAQVITIPGFVPLAEIGVDHHIKQINEKFNLTGADSLPYNVAAGETAMIK